MKSDRPTLNKPRAPGIVQKSQSAAPKRKMQESQQEPHRAEPSPLSPVCNSLQLYRYTIPYKIKYPCKLDRKQQITKSML